jgi:hypothetical protein
LDINVLPRLIPVNFCETPGSLRKRDEAIGQLTRQEEKSTRSLDTKSEFDTHVDIAGHLDDLAELNRLFRSTLEVLNREDLEAGLVDLNHISVIHTSKFNDIPAC